MHIVITGASGFVGRALIEKLGAEHSIAALDIETAALANRPNVRCVDGDLASPAVRRALLADGCDVLVHLATVPGGAAELDPVGSRRINVDAMYDLLEEAAECSPRRPRIVYASSIAVLGDPLPAGGVDDETPLSPRLTYAGHKAMMEPLVCMMSNRGAIDGVTVRLPAILARPKGPSGMKSAFMSDIFHALKAGENYVVPVSENATIWAESVECCATNLLHAATMNSAALPVSRAVTLPALRFTMGELASEIAVQTGASARAVRYAADPALEAAFGSHPLIATRAAEHAGFQSDGDIRTLVRRALERIA